MGTVSYGFESMDEVAHQLHVAFGSGDKGEASANLIGSSNLHDLRSAQKTDLVDDWCSARDSWTTRHVFKGEGRRFVSCLVSQCGFFMDSDLVWVNRSSVGHTGIKRRRHRHLPSIIAR